MAIRKFTENVNVISALPDAPSAPEYNASILKAKFDEAALKIKSYLNDTLIPDIENTAIEGVGVVRKLLVSYDYSGMFTFDTEEYPSVGGVYDVVLVGGGGGGSINSSYALSSGTGGGSGAVTKTVGAVLEGEYHVSVGSAGVSDAGSGFAGGTTFMMNESYTFFQSASGGDCSSQLSKIGHSGGIGGSDGSYADGAGYYGAGGDNEYGRGVRGAALSDDVVPAEGYGAGGWGNFTATCGAAFIYGYVRV